MTQLNLLNIKQLKRTTYKSCCICEKKFILQTDLDGKILTDCFHGELNLNWFDGWAYEFTSPHIEEWPVRFKNRYYKIVGFSKWSREVYYWLWKILSKKKLWEFWECPECNNRPDDV